MKRMHGMTVALAALLTLSTAGCAFEEGARDGLVDGTSSAVAALVEAPVRVLIERWFPK